MKQLNATTGFLAPCQAGTKKRRPGWSGRALGPVLALSLIATASVVLAAGEPAMAKTPAQAWDESAGLQILCADTLDSSARIFDSPDYQAQLLVPGKGEHAYLLGLKALSVRILPQKALAWNADDRPAPDLTGAADGGSFTRDGGVISFTADGEDWKIQPEPPLIGSLPLAKLLEAKPDYVHAAARFKPDAASIRQLHSVAADTKFVVFFGSWCSQCKHWLPRFLKALEASENPKFSTEFVGMSEDETEPKDLIQKYGVSRTPTIIVFQGDKELGRIEEKPEASIEADLAQILGPR